MPTILPVADIIEIGDASTYLSANYVSKQALFGGSVIKPTPPVQIAFVTDALRWGYDGGAQTTASLRSTANYLYWLCGKFQLQAQNIISGPGGGSVVPVPALANLPYPYDFIVTGSTSEPNPMKAGDSAVFLDGTNGTRDYRGYNLIFIRNNIPQSAVILAGGESYFRWSRLDGKLTVIPSAFLDEIFTMNPIG